MVTVLTCSKDSMQCGQEGVSNGERKRGGSQSWTDCRGFQALGRTLECDGEPLKLGS